MTPEAEARALRAHLGLTQEELATSLNVTQRAVSLWEHRHVPYPVLLLLREWAARGHANPLPQPTNLTPAPPRQNEHRITPDDDQWLIDHPEASVREAAAILGKGRESLRRRKIKLGLTNREETR